MPAVEFLNSKSMLTKVHILCCVLWAYVIDKLKIEKLLQACERNRAEVGLWVTSHRCRLHGDATNVASRTKDPQAITLYARTMHHPSSLKYGNVYRPPTCHIITDRTDNNTLRGLRRLA